MVTIDLNGNIWWDARKGRERNGLNPNCGMTQFVRLEKYN